MNKISMRFLTVLSMFVLLFAISGHAKADVASPYTKGITVLDSIPTSIIFGDEAPQPRIKINGQTLVPGQDYTCLYAFDGTGNSMSYTESYKTGTCYVTIDLASRTDLWAYLRSANNQTGFEGSIYKIASFNVEKCDLSRCTAAAIPDTTFDTSYISRTYGVEPGVTLYISGKKIRWDQYSVSYEDNKHGGTAKAIVVPVNNSPFTGSKTVTFKILPCSLKGLTSIGEISDITYTGSTIKPDFTVYVDGYSISRDDYSLTYANNVNAGKATVTVTGKRSFKDSESLTFTIRPRSITFADRQIAEQVFNGDKLTPKPVFTYNGKTLVEGKDYKIVSYSRNVSVTDKAEVLVEGINNFFGRVTYFFTITQGNIADAVFTFKSTEYSENPSWNIDTATIGSTALVRNTDYSVELTKVDGLTAYWKVTGKGNLKGTTTVKQTLKQRDISKKLTVNVTGTYTYTGSSIKPTTFTFSMNDSTVRLTKDVDYKVTYGTNTDAGTGTVTITGIGVNKGYVTANFTIKPASIVNASYRQITGADGLPDVELEFAGRVLKPDRDYTQVNSINVAGDTLTIKVTGKGNFSGTKTITITAAHVTPTPTVKVTVTPKPTTKVTVTPKPTTKVTVTPKPTTKVTVTPKPTTKVTVTPKPTTKVTVTPKPTTKVTVTPKPTTKVTVTPKPTTKVTVTPKPTTKVTVTPKPTTKVTVTPKPTTKVTTTPKPTTKVTVTPKPTTKVTVTPKPTTKVTTTPTPTVNVTATPKPTVKATSTPIPTTKVTATPTAAATATPASKPTAAPTKTAEVSPVVSVTVTPSPAAPENTVTVAPTEPAALSPFVLNDGDIYTDEATKISYKVISSKSPTVSLTGMSVKNAREITVPDNVTVGKKTYKVTEIAANAFKNNKKLKKVTIGKNIERIGKNAFYGCKNLKTVKIKTLKLSKKKVGKNAFKKIHTKAKFTVPKKKLKTYKTVLKARGVTGKKQKIKA